MYAILGDYKFNGYKGFQELTSATETELAQHAVIDGKPRLQAVGEKLREIGLKFLLHSSFSNPEKDIEILEGYRRRAEIISFVAGDGTDFGNYVIKSIATNYQQTDNNGRIIGIDIEVNLIEAYIPDLVKKKPAGDKLAITVPEVDITPLLPKPTDPLKIASELKIINTQSAQMSKELTTAQRITTQTLRAFRQAKKRIAAIKASLAAIEKVGQDTQSVINYYDSMQGQVAIVKNSTESLSAFVEAGDLNSSINASAQLRNSVGKLGSDAAPVNNLVTLRKDREPANLNGDFFDLIFNATFRE